MIVRSGKREIGEGPQFVDLILSSTLVYDVTNPRFAKSFRVGSRITYSSYMLTLSSLLPKNIHDNWRRKLINFISRHPSRLSSSSELAVLFCFPSIHHFLLRLRMVSFELSMHERISYLRAFGASKNNENAEKMRVDVFAVLLFQTSEKRVPWSNSHFITN